MKKPIFFIIGAPKCGTTSLAAWLAEHPQIYFSPRKEPHYFNQDGLMATASLAEYESLFAEAGPEHVAVGEGSTHYLYSKEAVPRILKYNPEARFIVCLRNPIEMAPALHSERLWQGEEKIRDFRRAWQVQNQRRKGKLIPLTVRKDPDRLQYGAYCRLGEQVDRLYRQVPKNRVLPVLLDDIRDHTRQEYVRILSFLKVSDDGRQVFPILNKAKRTPSVFIAQLIKHGALLKKAININKSLGLLREIKKKNTVRAPRKELSYELFMELMEYFREDVLRLGRLLNRDLSGWLEIKHSINTIPNSLTENGETLSVSWEDTHK